MTLAGFSAGETATLRSSYQKTAWGAARKHCITSEDRLIHRQFLSDQTLRLRKGRSSSEYHVLNGQVNGAIVAMHCDGVRRRWLLAAITLLFIQ